MPGGIFSRGFVRSYALEVGLDPDQTLEAFLAAAAEIAPRVEARAAVPEHESQFESRRRMANVVLTLIAISVPLIVAILYLTLR